jgi:hypothetical protein
LPLDGLIRSAQRTSPACFHAEMASEYAKKRDRLRTLTGALSMAPARYRSSYSGEAGVSSGSGLGKAKSDVPS